MPTPCPICGRQPDIDIVEPWPRGYGPAPWYAVCYQPGSNEHCVGADNDPSTKQEAIDGWERAVSALGARCSVCAGIDECEADCDTRRFDKPLD